MRRGDRVQWLSRGAARLTVTRCSAALILLATHGCSAPHATTRGPEQYLSDRAYRRSELEAALVNPSDGYAQLRLAHYATGTATDWDNLPEWNPDTELVSTQFNPSGPASAALLGPLELANPNDEAALLALGKLAFSRYPTQLAPYLSVALSSAEIASKYGLWLDDTRGVGGLVRAHTADGGTVLALTCSTCHSARAAAGLEDGLPNAALDLGAAIVAGSGNALDAETATHLAAWGPGRLDVTTSSGLEPARIADLRPARFQTNLQQDATLLMRGETTLAIRIETLIIAASGQVIRPPRVIALALAAYVSSLADALPPVESAASTSLAGARVFARDCTSCHALPTLAGAAVPLAVIGTDDTLGRSSDRGTGSYRVPSLRGVSSRGPLLHDGTLPSLDAMFDPARPTSAFAARLHGSGPVQGHLFGLDLDATERAALLAYLRAL